MAEERLQLSEEELETLEQRFDVAQAQQSMLDEEEGAIEEEQIDQHQWLSTADDQSEVDSDDDETIARRSVCTLVRSGVSSKTGGRRLAYIEACNELIRTGTYPSHAPSLLDTILSNAAEDATEEDLQNLLEGWTRPNLFGGDVLLIIMYYLTFFRLFRLPAA